VTLRHKAPSPPSPARVLWRSSDQLGEGPLWDHRLARWLWVDILRGIVHSLTPSGIYTELMHADLLIASIALLGEEDLLLATSQGLLKWSASSARTTVLSNPVAGLPVRFNDGRVDAAGRFWVGTMSLDPAHYAQPLGALYRVDINGTTRQMESGLTISNGLDWSPDGCTMYLTDTMRSVIYAYDFKVDSGDIGNRRVFATTPREHGFPDGLVVDSEGDVWSACFGGSCIRRYDAAGHLIETIGVPVSCPTAVAFGGENHCTPFLTTSQHTLGHAHGETGAGCVFTLDLRRHAPAAEVFGKGAPS
jgi:sugar lactone lactonase YvrE